MKRQNIYSLIGILMALVLLAGCENRKEPAKEAKILVVVPEGEQHDMHSIFMKEIQETLAKSGYRADTRILCLDMSKKDIQAVTKQVRSFEAQLKQEKWAPEVILVDGDGAARMLLVEVKSSYLDLKHTPVVLGALFLPTYWNDKMGGQNIVRWNDPMDFCANIDLAVELSGENVVEIELGHSDQDLLQRRMLSDQIKRPPYIDNSDFHETRLSEKDRNTLFKDSIMVLVLDAQKPWLNVPHAQEAAATDSASAGKKLLDNINTYAWRNPQLVVKNDDYAALIADKSGRPQFTATKWNFGNGRGDFLAGYFASYRTIGRDLAETAVKLLNGTPANSIPMKEHKKEYWMDYHAMKKLGMAYKDYRGKYEIVNAPYRVRHAERYYGVVALIVAGSVMLLGLLLQLLISIRWKVLTRRKQDIEGRMYISRLALLGSDCYQLNTADDIRGYAKKADPGQSETVEQILQSLYEPGTYQYELRGDMQETGNYEYWRLNFKVLKDKSIRGLLMNVNERRLQYKQLERAQNFSEESEKKENFMTNTSRQIYNPLNAICQDSQEITNEDLDDEKKKELCQRITHNSEILTGVINDMLLYSRIVSGRQQYDIKDIVVPDFMKVIYQEWKALVKDHTGHPLLVIEGRPNVLAQADPERLRDVMNQFLSNAVKFVKDGKVIIGWRYHLGKNQVELYVADTGVGISEEKQQEIFSLFWKGNDFIPGVGLGLNIAKKLADNMDGKILVRSQEEVGSRFSVIIPARIKPFPKSE